MPARRKDNPGTPRADKARIHQVQGGARKATSILQPAFYFNVWGQHCANMSLSPFRWSWALGSRMPPEQRASEEGLLISFLAYASIRWQSFALVSQCMSHILSYHERYMLVPRLDKRLGILHVWMKDFESRMITEEVSSHRRDALMLAYLGEFIIRELLFLNLPTLAEFLPTRASTMTCSHFDDARPAAYALGRIRCALA